MNTKWTAQLASLFSSVLAIICPLCIPALGAFLASIGLGFALHVQFLHSLLVVLLFLAVGSLAWSVKIHGKGWILIAGILGAVLIYAGRYMWFNPILMGIGAVLLIGVSLINLRLKGNCKRCR